MRYFEWGRYPAQQSDFKARLLQGESAYVDHGAWTRSEQGAVTDNSFIYFCNGADQHIYRNLVRIALTRVRVSLGHTPVLLSAKWNIFSYESNTNVNTTSMGLFRLVTLPNLDNATEQYYDATSYLPWGGDANIWAPVPGVDHIATPFASVVYPAKIYIQDEVLTPFDITTELGYCLQANKDLWFMATYLTIGTESPSTDLVFVWWKPTGDFARFAGFASYISVTYMNPVEFFACKADGSIDLMKLLDNSTGLDLNSLYLGAVEVSQMSTPVLCRVKNIGSRALPHLEVWDDRPEWSTPAAGTGNAGSAALEYPTLADAAVSQKYTIKFTDPTNYQVLAQAYKDNSANLNPTYGTTGWSGTVGSDFIAPSGGLVVPAAAWSGTAVANDTFVLYVTGNSTDTTWPADSNDQVQIAKDNGANAPDDTTWRPVCGQRTILTGTVTINATSKTLTVRHIVTSDWPNGTKVFVANAATIDEGVVTGQTATSITVTFPSATNNAYAAGDKVGSTLPIRGLGMALWAKTTGPAGASQSNAAYIPLIGAATLGFTAGQVCSIQSVDNTTLQEEFTIATAGVDNTRILAAGLLAKDYTTGAMVIAGGTGEAKFWLKIVATATTIEERKQLRLAVRT